MATKVHAFADDALGEFDAVALAAKIRKGEVDQAEVIRAAIARAEKVNPKLHAIELPLFEKALSRASRKRDGVFAGVPTFIKDNADLANVPTRHGSAAVNPRPAKRNGAFAKQYLAQGFVVMGKSTLPEFGFNATTEFAQQEATRNPWNTDYSSGASSGGSAALVAAGVVPVAHANDGGGSIRIPAACCGLVGLKPTRGRFINSEQARGLPINIVGEGIVSRSVRDQAHFFAGMETYYRNRKLPKLGLVEGPTDKRLTIGLIMDSITGEPTCPDTRAAVNATAAMLEKMGHRVQPVELPVTQQFEDDFSLYWGFLSFMVSRFGHRIMSPDFDASALEGLSVGLADHYRQNMRRTPGMLWRLRKTQQQYANSMRGVDAVLSPVLAHATPELGHLHPEVPFDELLGRLRKYVSFTPLNNTSGSPAISMPMGVDSRGLPIGVQLAGAHGGERTLLELAYALEAEQPFRRIQTD